MASTAEHADLLAELDVVDAEVHTGETAPLLMVYIEDDGTWEHERAGYASRPEAKGPFGADGWDRTAGGRIDWDPGAVHEAEDIEDKRREFGIDRTVFNAGLGFQTYMIPAAGKRVTYMRAMSWMDCEYVEGPNDAPGLDMLPSDYMREFYHGTQPIEESQRLEQFRSPLETDGLEDRLVFTTDRPRMDFGAPAAVAEHGALSRSRKRKLLVTNAERLFDLG